MRVRHKIPSIFSLSMVDVLCCALGCVILLWLLGAKQTDDETSELRQQAEDDRAKSARVLAGIEEERDRTRRELAGVEQDRDKVRRMLSGAEESNAKLNERVRLMLIDRDRAVAVESRLAERIRDLELTRDGLKRDLASQQGTARDLEARLKTSLARVTALEADVKAGTARLEVERGKAANLDRKLTSAEAKLKATIADADARLKGLRADLDGERGRVSAAQRRLADLDRDIEARKKELAGLTRSLEDANAARKKLEGNLAQRDKELAAARLYKDRLDAAEERERYLEKQLKDRNVAIADATKAIDLLKDQATLLRSARDSRFAGIALTGKRVVFLVDSSGSMEMIDEDTPAPKKWEEVRNAVGRLMRSLPGLEKYQIITFSTKAVFPLGGEGKWRDFDPTRSPEQVVKVLEQVKPEGGTNMYAGLEAAFRYRDDGLDTVYLLSDGLPNQGEGITEEQRKNMKEVDRGLLLGRHVRNKLKKTWNKPGRGGERVRINTVGFFYESPDLGSFLWALARENDGGFVGMSRP